MGASKRRCVERRPTQASNAAVGSFGRRSAELQHGGGSGAWDHYAALHLAHDGGWAEHNPSRIAQFFGQLGHRHGGTQIDTTLTAAGNKLEGTQTLPLSFLDNPRQAYTWPDATDNRLVLNVHASLVDHARTLRIALRHPRRPQLPNA